MTIISEKREVDYDKRLAANKKLALQKAFDSFKTGKNGGKDEDIETRYLKLISCFDIHKS